MHRLTAGRRRLTPATAPLAALLLAGLLAGCASGPPDGPPQRPPQGLKDAPDAVPRVEPLRQGGPNKPYEVLGRRYSPLTGDVPLREQGLASWYGRKFHGRRTASGEVYDMYAMTAAHKTMPLPSYARVRNPANGREIVVRVNDRGPFVDGRVIDLSYAAAQKLGVQGLARVELERLTFAAIRSGAWQRGSPDEGAPEAADAALPASVRSPWAAAAEPSAPAAQTAAPVPPVLGARAPAMPRAPAAAPAPATLPAATATETGERMEATDATATTGGAPPGEPVPTATGAPGFWVQLGAFREHSGAQDFRQRVSAELDWLAPLMAVFSDAPLFRLQAGPYASLDDARGTAERVREALRLVPVIVERR